MSLVGRRIGNYEIKAKIGEGGMGTVYLGEHPLIGKRVAIKVLLEELGAKEDVVARFFNEAKAVNDIGHLNIVDIVDFGKLADEQRREIVYFIMEFLDGESLSARIRRAGLPFADSLYILSQCCSALAASHKKGIVHRDLKPENLFLVARGADKNFVKILDFGIAKLTGDSGTASHKTRTGLVIGTPTYMSPEQCEGKGLIDHRSDVYSLGVVMFELLTGHVPFPGEGFGEVLVAHLTQEPPPLTSLNPDVPPALEAIVLHAIEKDRNRRFQDMNEFLAAIENPEAHAARWRGLPARQGDFATAASGAATLQSMPVAPAAPASQGGPPRPTTLEGAAVEVTHPPTRRPRSRAPLFAVVAAVLGLVGVGGYLRLSGSKGGVEPTTTATRPLPPSPPVEPPKVVPPVDDSVSVTVATDPVGARVYRADRSDAERETTPITFKMKRGDPPFDVQLRLEGYLPQTRTITSEESVKLQFSLVKQPLATVEAKPEPIKVSNVARPPRTPKLPKPPKSSKSDDGAVKPARPKPPTDPDGMDILQPDFTK